MRVLQVGEPDDNGGPGPSPPPDPSPSPPSSTENKIIDFDTNPDGNDTDEGQLPSDLWAAWGLTSITAEGGNAYLLDSSVVGRSLSSLGSPNKDCPQKGPGKGSGGKPGKPGANCDDLGKVLMIQDKGEGKLVFEFDVSVYSVDKIGLLDVDKYTTIKLFDSSNALLELIDVFSKGKNGIQTIEINKTNVSKMEIDLVKGGAVTFISFTVTAASVA